MAQKLQLLKLLQEIRGYAELGNRGADAKSLALSAVQLRSRSQPANLPRRRFSIPVRQEAHDEQPHRIPITRESRNARAGGRVMKIVLPAEAPADLGPRPAPNDPV